MAMLNYEIDPGLLVGLVPAGTELDCWNGKTFVSLVGFCFLNAKVFRIPFPFHRNFDEVNLRFYVRRQHKDGVRRGVVFVREIVPRYAIALVARIFYNERYVALPMRHEIDSGLEPEAEYRWKLNGDWSKLSVRANRSPALPKSGSHEEFITEHYWGYSAQRDRGCIEYEVRHPQWKVWTATEARFEGDMKELYGRELSTVLSRPPASAFLAEGSAVSVHRGRRL